MIVKIRKYKEEIFDIELDVNVVLEVIEVLDVVKGNIVNNL